MFLCAALCLLAGCTSAARGFCEAAGACDEAKAPHDPVGESDDSVDVCTADAQGRLDTLRANDEPGCSSAADALEGYYRCVQGKAAEGEECAGLRAGKDNECQDELDAANDELRSSGRACTEDEQ